MDILLPLLLTLPSAAGAMIAAALGLSIIVVALMYMISYAMQSAEMVALAKEELAALILTVFIIVFFVGTDGFLNSVVNGILTSTLPPDLQAMVQAPSSGGMTKSHMDMAIATNGLVEQKLKSQYIDLYLFEILIGFLSTISFPIGSPIRAVNIISFSLAPFTGLVLLSNAHTAIVESIGLMITLVWAKEFILKFARDTIPIMLFPLGLILRAIPFFRRTGSSAIAVAFAFYFILPFAVIFSNYLIFDAFNPVDFAYTPASASYFGTDRSYDEMKSQIDSGHDTAPNDLIKQFVAPSVVGEASDEANDPCAGNWFIKSMCGVGNLISSAGRAIVGFLETIWALWRFMVGMTGDFIWTAFNNPMMPSSASAGLYYFIIQEVTTISPFIILVMLTTVIEIIITITGYRSISLLIGGEAEIIGLTKVV